MPLKPIAERIMEDGRGAGRLQARRRGRGWAGALFLSLVLIGGAASGAWMLFHGLPGGGAGAAEPAVAGEEGNVFHKHASGAGIAQCRDLFGQMGQSLVAGSEYAAMSNWDESAPDDHAIWSLVGMTVGPAEGSQAAGGLLFAAPAGEGCEAFFARIVPSRISCDGVKEHFPAGSARVSDLEGSQVYRLPSGGTALLVPSAGGCVILHALQRRS